MTLKRKTIELIEVGPKLCLDTLYNNEAYEKAFVVETKFGELYTVELKWRQGYGSNYHFQIYGCNTSIDPDDITFIEVR